LVVSSAVVVAGAWLVLRKYQEPRWLLALVAVLAVTTAVTSSFHTTLYDHYKNVYLRATHPSYREGEDYETALQRREADAASRPFVVRAVWMIYIFYMRSQHDFVKKFDPHTIVRLADFPEFSLENAAIYRRYAGSLMRLWRSFFGFGSLVFGLAVSIGCDVVDYYMVFRLVLLNAVFYGYMRPRQRRASAAAFRSMAGAR
jgi:hypothetical protein